jgi:hypothetical protein
MSLKCHLLPSKKNDKKVNHYYSNSLGFYWVSDIYNVTVRDSFKAQVFFFAWAFIPYLKKKSVDTRKVY